RRLPGIESASAASFIPLTGYSPNGSFAVTGSQDTVGDAFYTVADAGYFQTLRIPLLSGRTFDAHDTPGGEDAAVGSKALADHFWPGRSALGQRVRFLGMDRYSAKWLTVVGVVGDVKIERLTAAAYPHIYVYDHQRPQRIRYGYLLVRGAGDVD